jgi:hypothetical protein
MATARLSSPAQSGFLTDDSLAVAHPGVFKERPNIGAAMAANRADE